ncbi:MAG TPA: hypothetical protein VHZ29_00010 [Rhizomicrobium sp.]|jgi:hypothetical protein|nr:hypothetical protein [Rhizomicrobium sp.]
MRFFMSAAFVFLGTAAWTAPALAVQDTPTTINGVETVCTGVGSAKDDPRWSAYPVKIVIANTAGENVAAMNIALSQNGKPVVQTTCDAPWILFKLPAGHYSASATMVTPPGTSRSTDFTIAGSGGQKELTIAFPAAAPNQ